MWLQAITLHTATWAENSSGELVRGDWVDTVTTGRVRPTSAREITFEGQRTLVDAVGILKPSEALTERDELTAGGKRYQVVGLFKVESETGNLDHLHADLRAVS